MQMQGEIQKIKVDQDLSLYVMSHLSKNTTKNGRSSFMSPNRLPFVEGITSL
jgi:hypothetical protein